MAKAGAAWHGQLARPHLAAMAAAPAAATPSTWAQLAVRLKPLVPAARLLADPVAQLAYSYDATGERRPPQLVVLAEQPAEVGGVLAAAAAAGVPVLPRGAGTNLSGGTLPLFGGLVLALQRLTEPWRLDVAHLQVSVGTGWVTADLQRALASHNMFYPPDPSSHRISTIGGNVQENSGGPHALRYGVTEAHVLAVEGYLADGTPIHLDRPAVPGEWDLLGVVIGSEGTLMVATEVTLAVQARPAGTTTALLAFATVASACAAVARVIAAHLDPAALELLDRPTIELVERFAGAGYPADAGAVLLVDLDGTADERQAALDQLDAATRAGDRLAFRTADGPAAAERLWIGRRAAYGALARVSAHVFVQDVTVPRPQLAAMMDEVLAIAQQRRLSVLTVAHAGDGNLHPTIGYDPANPEELQRLFAADQEILAAAAARDGSITGEHGVGIDKLKHLPLMYSRDELAAMLEVKQAFDPELRLNPGKAIWTVLPPRVAPDETVPHRPHFASAPHLQQVREAIREAQAAGRRLQIVGAGLRVPPDPSALRLSTQAWTAVHHLDAENLTATVDSGLPVGELDGLLAPFGLEWAADAWGAAETVGGMVAGALPAWREAGSGPVRQQVLGVEMVDGGGRALRFGRPVLKNVAGYDLTKLLVGSFGRLGVLTAVTLRLRPRRPLTWRCLAAEGAQVAAAAWASLARPDRPEAVLGRPGQVITAWVRDPGAAWGPAIADPRPEWGALLAAQPMPRFGLHRCGRAGFPPAHEPWTLWWPLSGVWLGSTPPAPPPEADGADPAARHLAEQVRRAFDPHDLWKGGEA